jgi:hypothetical protein
VKNRLAGFGVLCIVFFALVSLNVGQADALSWEQVGQANFGGAQSIRITRLIEFNNKLFAVIQNLAAPNTTTQIWYSSDGANWTQSTGYPSHYTSVLFNDVEVFGGYLYVAQSNGGITDEAYIYRTSDGINWSTSVIDNGFGDANNIRILDIKAIDKYLYADAVNFNTGTQIWRSSTGDPGTWNRVVTTGFGHPNNAAAGIDTFNGNIYAATTSTTGAEIWESADGSWGSWSQVGVTGLDPVNTNYGVNMSVVYKGAIYFLAYEDFDTPRMWKSTDGVTMTPVTSAGLDIVFSGLNDAPIGTTGLVVGDTLWLGMSNVTNGAKLKYSTDGANWTQEGDTGFGNANNKLLHPIAYFNGQIYIAFDNVTDGAQIWRTRSDLPYTGGHETADTITSTPRTGISFLTIAGVMLIATGLRGKRARSKKAYTR